MADELGQSPKNWTETQCKPVLIIIIIVSSTIVLSISITSITILSIRSAGGLYPGYKMGPLAPTMQGQAATLTRAKPSYLPRDISTLSLKVTEEPAGCLHLTYLQLSTTLASSLVSGLGEHYTSLLLDHNWTSLTLWNRDMAPHQCLLVSVTGPRDQQH
ncbi:unnamed protein product [Pleuronectes platessa]|uniref:Uncharacterized protein n=1 Tax=Pleuronectes platessa TaxID=8262 RepID=A0A9N7VXL0_PLEPL|nr:unnamed protein product [Pleuronectes platessa]